MSLKNYSGRKLTRAVGLALAGIGLALLAELGQAQALPQQCEALTDTTNAEVMRAVAAVKDTDPAARIKAAQRLASSCERRAVTPLLGLLKDADPGVRAAAVEALGRIGDPESIDPLIEMATDADMRVIAVLGPALCAFQAYKASYAALNAVAINSNGVKDVAEMRARCNAILAVNQLKDVRFSRKSLFFLFGYLGHPDAAAQKVAEATMAALKETRNGPHELVGLLKQSVNPNQRRICAYWIGQLKIEAGREVLEEVATNDRDLAVQEAAQGALTKLGKKVEE